MNLTKKLLLGAAGLVGLGMVGSAQAADMPQAAPPPLAPVYVPPPFTWTGFYIGGNFGGAWASTTLTDNLTGSSATGNLGGWLGGGQVGFNYQMGSFVLGVEGTLDWSSLNSTTGGIITAAGPPLQVAANTTWVSTLAARFGFAADHALFYGKAGGGWVGNNATITNLATGSSANSSNTNSGWALGAGVEYAFTPNWTAKVEYDYLGLRGWTATSPVDVVDTVNLKRQLNIVMAGINYKFGW
jgi:outer membrane immunogenic protein